MAAFWAGSQAKGIRFGAVCLRHKGCQLPVLGLQAYKRPRADAQCHSLPGMAVALAIIPSWPAHACPAPALCRWKGYTPLLAAIKQGHTYLVDQLTRLEDCEPAAEAVGGATALHLLMAQALPAGTGTLRLSPSSTGAAPKVQSLSLEAAGQHQQMSHLS